MFLSKIFGIFKRNKNKQAESSGPSGPVVTPAGVTGAAAGMSQPNTDTPTPDSGQVAQAPSAPDFSTPDTSSQDDTPSQPSTEPEPEPAPEQPQSNDSDEGISIKANDEISDVTPPPAGDTDQTIGGDDDTAQSGSDESIQPAPQPGEDTLPGDDNQNLPA